jgi:hypothetical protein
MNDLLLILYYIGLGLFIIGILILCDNDNDDNK